MKKQRITYATIFIIIFIVEVLIALYIDDRIIRPYIGDVLVTMLICSFCRIFLPKGIRLLPVYVMVFATLVEIAQYFQVVTLLGVQDNPFFCTIIGTSFSHIDLICYAVGCLLFWAADSVILHFLNRE